MKLQNSFRDYTAESALFVRRALVAFTGILLLTGVLIANLYNLQIVRYTDYQTRSNENRIKLVPIAPSRGIIYDRNGTPLALNRTIYQIEMMPEKVDNVQDTLNALRSVVDLTDDDIAAFKKERARSHRFTSIPVKTNLTEVQVARFAVNQYRFPGVEVKGYKRRYYPYGSALTHVIGYVSKINDKDVDRLDKDGKLANYAAKKWKQTGGVLDLSDRTRQRKLMSMVPVEEVWGVGRRISKRLNLMGINTALQLAECTPWFIRKNFNVVLERTVRELCGEPCLELDEFAPTKQQIICSRSFGHRISDYQEVRQAVCAYAERAAEKLRIEKQYCRQIAVFLRTSPHAANEQFYGNQAGGMLLVPSNDTRDIVRIATESLDRIWVDGHRYMKAGVMLGDFFSQGIAQLDLFDECKPRAGSQELMQVLDQLNQPGKSKVWFAGQGINKSWAMKREMLSPAYTTRVADLPVVK